MTMIAGVPTAMLLIVALIAVYDLWSRRAHEERRRVTRARSLEHQLAWREAREQRVHREP